ncbi:MAG TPA: hypothetical protein VEQ60_09165, partial [Longimicrobium sp.]|nr:hypothetical protein [Longimicrobium sp.]
MPDTLLVPIHLDALQLTEPRTVASSPADFTRLPWSSGTRDLNPDTPYLAEAIASQPFQNQYLRLPAGVHLHWSLPDALTRAVDGEFAPVPNRWMVTRFAPSGSIQAQWVVESDYLHPPGVGTAPDAIVFPVTPGHRTDPPFRYCGRTVPLASWSATPPLGAAYLPQLTAVGHGDPAFAAFYPSCRGVFGLHDPFTGSMTGTRYEVFGWYAAAAADPLARLRARHPGATAAALRTAQREELRWTIADSQNVPDGIV